MKYIILFFLSAFSIYSKERIVVLDFVHSKNVSQEIAVSSYQYFVSELNKTEEFSIIEKSQVKEVLKEVAFQQSGCTDTACEIQVGEMLAAQKIASGNIIKKEKKYIISINIRNVSDKSLEFSETIDLYDLNQLELTMNTLTERIIHPNTKDQTKYLTLEEIKQARENQRLEREAEINKQALHKSILFPGWGHLYLNRKSGFAYISLYAISFLNCIYNYSYLDKKMTGETKKEVHDNRTLYYFINREINPSANQPVIAYYFFQQGNSIIKHTYNQMGNINVIGVSVALTIMLAAIGDIKSIKNEKEDFSFSTKPEYSPALQNNNYYPQKGTHLEFTYTMRF